MTPEQIDTYCHRLAEAWKKMPEYLFLDMVNIGVAESGVFLVVVPNVSNEALITAIESMVSDGNKD